MHQYLHKSRAVTEELDEAVATRWVGRRMQGREIKLKERACSSRAEEEEHRWAGLGER